MSSIYKLEFISELNEITRQENPEKGICLFLGAGADISSGGVLFSDLKKESVAFVRNQKIHDYESSDLIDKEFNRIFETLDEQSRCRVIQYLINESADWSPSDGYKLLILLAKENCISSVITTNFANLLETTQDYMGIDAFQIFTPATAIPSKYFIRNISRKPVYLKMHGDIWGNLITHLTTSEINNKKYQKEFINLFEHLIKNKTIVFLGYSGWDTKISEIFENNISHINNIYWCNINEPDKNAPLIKVFSKNNISIKYINYNFDKVLQVISAEFLKNRILFQIDSIFIWAILKSKIKILQTEFMNKIKSETKGILSVSRTKIDIFDDFIVNKCKNFCVITGNPGIGKSMLIAELCEKFENNEEVCIVPLNAMITYSDNLLDYIAKKLGYASKSPYTVLYQFSKWAYEQDKYFIFAIDNLGNNIGTIKEIASLLNKLIELSYIIRNRCHIKFVVTLQTNIWNNVHRLLDTNYLNSIIWNEENENNNCSVRLGNFDEFEMKRAKANLFSLSNDLKLSPEILELIKEPSLYGLIQSNIHILDNIYEFDICKILEKHFFCGISKSILENLSYSILCDYVDSCIPVKISLESINHLKNDLKLKNILNFKEDTVEFKNELFLECCLANYLSSKHYIDTFLQKPDEFIQDYLLKTLPPPIYNGIVRYLGVTCNDFGKIIKLVFSLLDCVTEKFIYVKKFVNDIFRYMAQYNAKQYLNNIKNFDTSLNEFKSLLPFFIHCLGFMNDACAFPVLSFIRNLNISPFTLECSALINDRFSIGLRSNNSAKLTEFFNRYIDYILIPDKPIMSLFPLLWIMGRVGKDNTSSHAYQVIAELTLNKIKSFNYNISALEITELKNAFLKNAYFIFFNADDNLEERYHDYPNKSKMIPILTKVIAKKDLESADLKILCSLVNSFENTIDFFVGNMVFIYMASYDFDYALRNLSKLYNTFDENTSVLELDFYSSALFFSFYVNNPYDRQNYLEFYKRLVKDFELKMFISPSMSRISSCRKFEDKFEVEFEDGFNILTDYTYTAPMDIKSSKKSVDEYLSVFWDLLNRLECNGMYEEIVNLIKAVNQMSVNWPEESLEALSKFFKYDQPIIRKAIIRTLKENYLRYPNITVSFLSKTGGAFAEDELLEIYSATNSQIENRTLEQLQWARMIYYVKEYINPQIMEDLLDIFRTSYTLDDALYKLTKKLLIQ